MQDLYEIWCGVAPWLTCRDILTLRQVHKAAHHPFTRDDERMLFRLRVNKNGAALRSSLVESLMPLPEKWTVDSGTSWRPNDIPQYQGARVSMPPCGFRGFLSDNPGWGMEDTTRRKRLMEYIDARVHIIDKSGRVVTLVEYEVVETHYVLLHAGWRDHRLAFDVVMKDFDGHPRCRIGLIAGHHTVCISDVKVIM